jgi:EmrB/QacA subfamily drug resistance transporter
MGIVVTGTYLVVLDATVLGVALASISDDLHAERSVGIDWVITSYLVAVGVVQPATAWLAARIGRKQVFIGALAAFTFASLLAGIAPNLPLLLVARVLQGAGGGAMMPVGMAMVWDQFPPARRGMAMSIHSLASMAAPAFGPVLGGWFVTSLSWRYLFLINLPIGTVALVLAWRWLEVPHERQEQRLDWTGWALTSAAVVAVVLGSREASTLGWTSGPALALIAAAVLLVAAAIWWLRRAEHPLLDLRLFSVRTYSLATVIIGLMSVPMYARVAFLPTELQLTRGMTAQRVGVLFMFGALAIAAAMPVGGWLIDRIGGRWPVVVGQGVVAVSLWELAHLTPDVSEARLVAILVGGGFGIGLAVTAPQVVGMNALPQAWVGQATTMTSVLRQVASAIATSGLAAVVIAGAGAVAPTDAASRVGEVQDAYNDMFLVAMAAAIAMAVLGFWLPSRRRGREDAAGHEAVRAEAVEQAAEAASGV